ncbi:MAG: DUF4296 domain-containing protein [Sediminibacterium sp.]|nr:DUF4296 domain-containing protein [Sediminibacterium sp.]
MKNVFIIGMLFFAACASEKSQNGKLLPIGTMQKTVWQLMQVDEYLSRQTQADTTIQPALEKAKYYQRVFNLNKVDRADFYATMSYLDKHPVEMKELMDSVEALSKREKLELIKH